MKRIGRKLLDFLKLFVIALVIVAVLVLIAWYIVTADLREIERRNKADPVYQEVMAKKAEEDKANAKRQKKLDKIEKERQAEKKAIADFEKSIKGKYTKEYLLNKISSDKKIATRLSGVGNYDCINYWYTSHNWEDEPCYDELSYYVFKNERCAKKAFRVFKERWIDNETDSGKNYVQGWEANVMDANVEVFIYQVDNMIITAELQVISAWAEPIDGESTNSAVSFNYRKNFVIDNFR